MKPIQQRRDCDGRRIAVPEESQSRETRSSTASYPTLSCNLRCLPRCRGTRSYGRTVALSVVGHLRKPLPACHCWPPGRRCMQRTGMAAALASLLRHLARLYVGAPPARIGRECTPHYCNCIIDFDGIPQRACQSEARREAGHFMRYHTAPLSAHPSPPPPLRALPFCPLRPQKPASNIIC